jgi:hypothetical protein
MLQHFERLLQHATHAAALLKAPFYFSFILADVPPEVHIVHKRTAGPQLAQHALQQVGKDAHHSAAAQRKQYLKFSRRLFSVSNATASSRLSACTCIRRVSWRYIRISQHRTCQRSVSARVLHLYSYFHHNTLAGEQVSCRGLQTGQAEDCEVGSPHRALIVDGPEQRRAERACHAEGEVVRV